MTADPDEADTAFGDQPARESLLSAEQLGHLGDSQVKLDGDLLPGRHQRDEGLAALLGAEQIAPEQVRHHFISRQLVLTWMRQRGKPSPSLTGLASRLRLT